MNGATRHLLLMRHASAAPGADDRARPLTPAGAREALMVGRALQALAPRGLRPEQVLVSPARRAQETWSAVQDALRGAAAAETEDGLYLASAGELLARLRLAPAAAARLLVVGHNPGLSDLLHQLLDQDDGDARQPAARGLVPAACAVLRVRCAAWRELAPGCGELVELLRPPHARI